MRRPATIALACVLASSWQVSPAWSQGLLDSLKQGAKSLGVTGGDSGSQGAASNLSESTIADGLREALTVGVDRVVGQLGSAGGFLDDGDVRIPLPGPLADIQSALRLAGLSGMADDLELRMNRAAEQAVPVAQELFTDAIAGLTFQDIMGIYNGPDDSATRYLEDTTGGELSAQMRPIVETALQEAGAVQAFDQLVGEAGSLPLIGDLNTSLTDHVLERASSAVFGYLAVEEKAIRQDPVSRSTDLLKTVFGS